MRISAAGLASTIAVAIDQILRLAPSINGPIEPVVSSTNATSTIGLPFGAPKSSDAARTGVAATNAAKHAGAKARAMLANMGLTLLKPSDGGHDSQASRLAVVRIAAGHRRISAGICQRC